MDLVGSKDGGAQNEANLKFGLERLGKCGYPLALIVR
jgi:hypothetical protein